MMHREKIEQLAARMPLAKGYHFELLTRAEIGPLVDFIETWFPDIKVGGASCYLRARFYTEKVFLEDTPERDVFVVLLKRGDELAGMFSCERDLDTRSLYAALAVAAPQHRGANLAQAAMTFTEEIGRQMGMGFIHGMATLKAPYAQRAFERAGWQLTGITPGYDREMVAPGVVKRVYEAVYAKVLVPDDGLLLPQRQNLTPRTRAFFDHLFGAHRPENMRARELEDV